MKIVVYHTYLGCDSGCCGHAIETGDDAGRQVIIAHPDRGDDYLAFAQDLIRDEMGEEHVADLDWENSLIIDD